MARRTSLILNQHNLNAHIMKKYNASKPYFTYSYNEVLADYKTNVILIFTSSIYCKSTNFGVLLYLANLANCVSSLIFVAANIYVDCTLHRRAAGRRQI